LQVSVAVQKSPSSHASPAAFAAHVPPSHVKHEPVQAVLQQTPSTQWELVHWESAEQASPLGFPAATQTPDIWWRPDVAAAHFPLQQLPSF
jgi:alkaline phosphatase